MKDAPAAPFVEAQAALDQLQRSAQFMADRIASTLKPFGLTLPQYELLRILGAPGTDSASCAEIGVRMPTKDSDITRLLTRLETRGLLSRLPDAGDRRVVKSKLTPRGASLLEQAESVVRGLLEEQFRGLSGKKLRRLTSLLQRLREEES
jgi:DNA-binding MarR family transcriptional regulator